MSYYLVASPVILYVGLSGLLSLSYLCIECANTKGKLDSFTNLTLICWLIISIIIGIGISGIMMGQISNSTITIIILIVAITTLIISSSMVYFTT